MMAPVLPYVFRGVIWYQGESSALDANHYRKLLPGLIKNWRDVGHDQLPFLIVQLPNHGTIPEQPSESAWAELRGKQRRAPADPVAISAADWMNSLREGPDDMTAAL